MCPLASPPQNRPTMYLLEFSRYDCPGCDRKWFFDSIEEIEAFIKDAYPKFPVAEYTRGNDFYPNGLWIYEIVGRDPVLKMRSMYDRYEEDDFMSMPVCFSPKVTTVAKLIYDLQVIIDHLEEGGAYQWPLDQIIPRVDKEDLVKTVFRPVRVVRMGGVEWLESV